MTDKLIDIYINKFIKGQIDFYGIKLIPEHAKNGILWRVKNPKNLSYTSFNLQLGILKTIYDFVELAGVSLSDKNNFTRILDVSGIYVSPDLRDKINSASKKITQINIDSKYVGDYSLELEPKHVFLDSFGEELEVYVGVILKKLIDNKKNLVIEPKRIIDIYDKMYGYDMISDFRYELVAPITEEIENVPTIFNKNVTYYDPIISFYSKTNDVLSKLM